MYKSCAGVLARRDYSWLWFIILGWFLTSAATAENQQAVVQSRLRTVAVRQIMTADLVTAPASDTVAQFQHDFLPWSRHSAFPVVDAGQVLGLVTLRRINQVPAAERGRTTLRDVACSLDDVARTTPAEQASDVLPRLNECSEGRALVFADGHLAGIVSPSDISRALQRISGNPGLSGQSGAELTGMTSLGHKAGPCSSGPGRRPAPARTPPTPAGW